MTDYRKIRLRNLGDAGFVSHGNAAGLRPLRRLAPLQVGLGQDRLTSMSRRIIAQGGLQGANDWMVSAVAQGETPTLENPSPAAAYVVWRTQRQRLNPGCILALRVVYWPSGHTQNIPDDQPVTSAKGQAVVAITWHAAPGGSDSTLHGINTEPAPGELSPPPAGYPAWGELRARTIYMAPTGWASDDPTTRLYSLPGVEATIVVGYVGSPRIAYWCIYEVPHEVVTELADSVGPWGGMTAGSGMPLSAYPSDYPIDERSDDDPYHGASAMLAAAGAFGAWVRGGAVRWTAGREHDLVTSEVVSIGAGTGDDTYPPLEVTSTSPVQIGGDGAGLPVTHMAYLAGYDASLTAGTRTRAVLCIISVRWKVSGGTGTLTVRTAPHSYATVTTTSTTETTTQVAVRLDVGPGPSAPRVAALLASVTSTNTVSLWWVSIEPMPGG